MKNIKTTIRILILATLGILALGPPTQTQAAQTVIGQEDLYESNDTCSEATTIQPDGTVQTHNFHDEGDIDWVKFTAPTNGTYRIHVNHPDNSQAYVNIVLHNHCGLFFNRRSNINSAPNMELTFEMQAGQTTYMQLRNTNSSVAGSDVTYELSVQQLEKG